MMEWISCTHKLPEKEGSCLIICSGRRAFADYVSGKWYINEFLKWYVNEFFDDFSGDEFIFSSFDSLCKWTQDKTTHWMTIPELSKDE